MRARPQFLISWKRQLLIFLCLCTGVYSRNTAYWKGKNVCVQSATLFGADSRFCLIKEDRQLSCFDFTSYGSSIVTPTGAAFDVDTSFVESTILSADATTQHICIVFENGELWCQGDNTYGELGTGDYSAKTSLTQVDLGIDRALAVFTGNLEDQDNNFTCVLLQNGSVVCFGAGYGGTELTTYWNGAQDGIAIAVAATLNAFCVITEDGAFHCAPLATNPAPSDTAATTRMTYDGLIMDKKVVSVAVDESYICATLEDFSVACWGSTPYHEWTTPTSLELPYGGQAMLPFLNKNYECVLLVSGDVACVNGSSDTHQSALSGRNLKAAGMVIFSDSSSVYQQEVINQGSSSSRGGRPSSYGGGHPTNYAGGHSSGHSSVRGHTSSGHSSSSSPHGDATSSDIATEYGPLDLVMLEDGSLKFVLLSPPFYATDIEVVSALGWRGYICPGTLESMLAQVSTDPIVVLGAGIYTLSDGYAVTGVSTLTLQGSSVPGETIIDCGDATMCLSVENVASVTISGITFTSSTRRRDRRTQTSSAGPALQLSNVQNAVISDVVFRDLLAVRGAALSVICAYWSTPRCQSLDVTRSLFLSISATEYAGAVYLELPFSGIHVTFTDCTFSGNSAGIAGGAVFVYAAVYCESHLMALAFSGCDFEDNFAVSYGNDKASNECFIRMAAPISHYQSGDLVLDDTGTVPTVLIVDAFGGTVVTENGFLVSFLSSSQTSPMVVSPDTDAYVWTWYESEFVAVNGKAAIDGIHIRAQTQYSFSLSLGGLFGSWSVAFLEVPIDDCAPGTYRDLTSTDTL